MSMSHPVFEHFHLTEYPSRWHTGTVRIKGIDACVCPQMRVCTTIRARAPITASIHLRNRYSSKINILHNFDNFTNDIRMTLITARSSCCWKVMFSQACVIHSVHGGVYPSMPFVHHPGIPTWSHPHYGQQAGGKHPTGMFSCFTYFLSLLCINKY